MPLDPSYPAERLAFMIEDAPGSRCCSTRSSSRPRRSRSDPIDGTDDGDDAGARGLRDLHSGSTGRPKGVEGLHRGALNRFHWMYERYPFAADEVCCHKTSLSFVDAVWEIFGPLLAGVRLRLVPPGDGARPRGRSSRRWRARA